MKLQLGMHRLLFQKRKILQLTVRLSGKALAKYISKNNAHNHIKL